MSISNVFKKAANLPIVITFTHSVSKAREYYGCPRITATCQELGFKATAVGYGYDMIGALMSDFINSECTQYAIQSAYAFNELRGDSYNPIHYIQKTDQFRVNFCTIDVDCFFNDDLGMSIKFTYKRSGKLSSIVISSK